MNLNDPDTRTKIAYAIDILVGIIVAGLIGAGQQYLSTGFLDWHAIVIAFLGGALGFSRKWAQVHYGVDAPPAQIAKG